MPKLPCLIVSQAPDTRVQRNGSLVFLDAHGEFAITWLWAAALWMKKVCLSQCLCQETDGSWPHDPWSHIHSTKWRDMTSLLFSEQSTIDYSLLMLPCRWQAGTRGKWRMWYPGPPKGKINVIWFVFHPRITSFFEPPPTGHCVSLHQLLHTVTSFHTKGQGGRGEEIRNRHEELLNSAFIFF